MLFLLLLPLAMVAACDKVPLLAPTGTVITLFPTTTTVPLNSEVTIVATVIENGVAAGGSGSASGGTSSTSRSGNGTPVQNGTVVTFTTTIGRIEPSEARTHNGEVTVKLITGNTSGSATITAYSGGASAQITNLKVGSAAVKSVTLSTSPQALGATGGTVSAVANVTDEGGAPVPGIAVTFSTDVGSISPPVATTDAGGNATTTLSTTATAKVTATVGSVKSNDATVTVRPFSIASFTADPAATSAGTPVKFTINLAEKANVSNVRIEFGDGASQNLGPITTNSSVSHVYGAAGQYTATATATANGAAESLTTTVIIGSLPITLTAAPASPTVNSPVTLTVGGLGSAQVDHYVWTFDDGTGSVKATSPQLTHTFASRGLKNVRVDVIGIGGGTIGSAAITLDVQ